MAHPTRPAAPRWRWLLATLLLLVSASCGGGGGLTFEAPSEDEMRARVHLEPTATLDATTLPGVLEQVRAATTFATAFVRFTTVYAESFASVGEPGAALTASGLARQETALTEWDPESYRASGYIRFSCPGPDLVRPDYEFGSGDARVESPGVIGAGTAAPTLARGSVFQLRFDACEVGGDVIGGVVYGLFETPWVLVAEATAGADGGAEQPVAADIELAANRLTVILPDDEGGIFKLIVTHPQGTVTSATVYGRNARCTIGMDFDPRTGLYQLTAAAPRCDF
jgi:hypothetical protein